ncbi:MAG TPA: hypothetical protein PKK99_12960, partial [Bacteroidia bacterium]|nr:hypothetical protein [Bacteroidia bacterium]
KPAAEPKAMITKTEILEITPIVPVDIDSNEDMDLPMEEDIKGFDDPAPMSDFEDDDDDF